MYEARDRIFSSIEYLVIQVKAFDIRVQRYSQNILAVS